jgi:hypothetical protein
VQGQGHLKRARRAALFGLLALACDPRAKESSKPDCPACECVCDCKSGDGGSTVAATTTPTGTDIGELVADATRKMNHGDGEGCLSDLARVAELDSKMDARLAVLRGQCEMAAGKCQAGKDRVARWYERETAMSPDRAALTAEQLASMHCKGGDANDRDRLLAALFKLSDGAYMNTREPEFCAEHLRVARSLIPKVKPTGPDDGQLTGGIQALFHTAASCFAKAGDCRSALSVYTELFPAAGLSAIPDPAQREKIVRESFDSSIVRCKGK